jgi:hypothetical protein
MLVSAACWSNRRDPQPVGSWEVLTLEQIRSHDRAHAYFVVQRLRPGWLQDRGHDARRVGERLSWTSGVRLYVDGIPSTLGIQGLLAIPAEHVLEIRHLSPMDATTRFGTGHSDGAIMVITKAGDRNRWF